MQEFAYIHEEGTMPEGLKGIPFLEPFDQHEADDLLSSASILECDPGDLIIKEGELESRIYILISGGVRVEKSGKLLAEFDLQGAIFGELAAIDDEARSASVIADSKVLCLAIDQKFLKDIKPPQENPSFYAALYKAIAQITVARLKATSKELALLERKYHELKASRP